MVTTAVVSVGIVFPVHNRRDTTLRALRSLARLERDGVHVFVVVVDDGSTDGTAEAIRLAFPDVEVVPGNGSLFYAGGTNAGLRRVLAAGADYAIMANDDAIFNRRVVLELVACARTYPRAVVGAVLLLWDTAHRVFQVGQTWDTWYGGWRIPTRWTAFDVPPTPWEVESLAGNCVLVPTAALREAGLLDDARFPHHWADAEFSARLRRHGWQLLVAPRARVFCQPNTYPPPLRTLSPSALLRALFGLSMHPMNLPGQWRLRWSTAPTRLQGVVACVIFTARLALRGLRVGPWPDWPDPPPGPLARPPR